MRCTRSLADAGVYYESPKSYGNPVIAAYGSEDGLTVAVQYLVVDYGDWERGPHAHWANIDRAMVVGALRNPWKTNALPASCRPSGCRRDGFRVSPEPRMDQKPAAHPESLRPLLIKEVMNDKDMDGFPADSSQLVVRSGCVYFLAQPPGTEAPVLIASALPSRHYRTFWGYAAQTLMPFAVVLDVITSPYQFLGGLAEAMTPR